jgi:acyl carrier protein
MMSDVPDVFSTLIRAFQVRKAVGPGKVGRYTGSRFRRCSRVDTAVAETVINFIGTRGEVPGDTLEDRLRCDFLDEGVLDSMGLMETIFELEAEFGIRFESNHLQSLQFRTIGGVVEIIEELRGSESQSTSS